jgi:predicted CopG family antitoxin
MYMAKTTVMLREDVYEVLKKKYGARGMSKAINEILAEALLKGESMFGTMKKTSLEDLRNHEDRL